MKKKIWFYLCCFLIAFIICNCVFSIYQKYKIPDIKFADSSQYKNPNPVTIDELRPENGFIPDAKTAEIIGEAIIDQYVGENNDLFSYVEVEYDFENRIWIILKSYFPHHGAYLLLDQDTGAVIDIVRWK